jgi:hypothetical protein
VRTGSRRRHAIAFIAEERHVQLERLDGQAAGRKRVKDMVGIQRTVITADPGMITPDDQVRTAEVLSDQRM